MLCSHLCRKAGRRDKFILDPGTIELSPKGSGVQTTKIASEFFWTEKIIVWSRFKHFRPIKIGAKCAETEGYLPEERALHKKRYPKNSASRINGFSPFDACADAALVLEMTAHKTDWDRRTRPFP